MRVYLSSSFRDLKEVRADLISHINKQKEMFSLVNMEDYSPESTYPADKCVADVESCDIYIGVFAWRYGSIEPRSGLSITELELLAAEKKGIEILAYVLAETAAWPRSMMDRDPTQIERLRKHVLDNHLGGEFHAAEDLCALVVSGLNAAKDRIRSRTDMTNSPSWGDAAKQILWRSILRWLLACHERLEFRGIRHERGGAVSVELRQVYLALQADHTNPLERAAARQALLAELAEAIESGEIEPVGAEYASWYVVAGSPTMPSLEARDRLNALLPSRKELLNLAEVYFRESQLVVLGDPGSGKTTVARWLTLVSAQALAEGKPELVVPLHQVDPTVEDLERTISLGKTRLPVLVRIAEYVDERQRSTEVGQVPPTLLEFLGRQTWFGNVPVWDEASPQCGEAIGTGLLNQMYRKALQDGEALIILDGLDEVPASALRDEIVEEVDTFAQQWIRRSFSLPQVTAGKNVPALVLTTATADAPGNRLIVTSRIAGYHLSPLQGDLAHVTVESMSPRAVARFVTNWMLGVHHVIAPPGTPPEQTHKVAYAQAQQFLNALAEPRQRGGREMATNPLLCGILATVYRQRQALPQERVELYRQAVELFFEIWLRRHRDDDQTVLMKYELYDILEPIAEHIHRHEPTGLIPENQLRHLTLQFLAKSRGENPLRATAKLRRDVDEMIRVVREDVGLLAARGEGIYGFLHLTFQEYLAARALIKDLDKACERLSEHLGDARWREIIRLALGYLNIENNPAFQQVVRDLVGRESPLEDLLPQATLTVIGALPDLRLVQEEVVELLTGRLLHSYAQRDLLLRLPKRRELLQRALHKLLETEGRALVESYFCNVLERRSKGPEFAFPVAHLLGELDYFSPRLFQALQRARSQDSATWNWPIHKALRLAVTPPPGQPDSRVAVPYGCLPFRQALLTEPSGVEHIRGDFDWLRVVLAFYGGLGDYDTSARIAEYFRMVGFLQQEGSYRERYRQAFLGQWGQGDGDFVYNMAVYLDTTGGGEAQAGPGGSGPFRPPTDPSRLHLDAGIAATS